MPPSDCCRHQHRSPKFPLTINWWFQLPALAAQRPPDAITPGALHVPVGVQLMNVPTVTNAVQSLRWLYLPGAFSFTIATVANVPDVCEVPAGSGRWYRVIDGEWMNLGFPNQFRVAWVFPEANPFTAAPWPFMW